MFYEFMGKQLRLDAARIAQLEDKLGGKSPLSIFTEAGERSVPPLKSLLLVLHMALQPLNHGMKAEDAYALYDKYIEEGHTMVDFFQVIVEVYQASGLLPKEADAKN